jgi:hypothetical protein
MGKVDKQQNLARDPTKHNRSVEVSVCVFKMGVQIKSMKSDHLSKKLANIAGERNVCTSGAGLAHGCPASHRPTNKSSA